MPPQSLRHIKRRIRSIENTQKLTKAMEMISVAKLRAVQGQVGHFKRYFERVNHLMGQVLSHADDYTNPLLAQPKKRESVLLCLVTSDTGLCGNYNNNMLRLARKFIREQEGRVVRAFAVGKKGFSDFQRTGVEVVESFVSLNGRYSGEAADKIAQGLISRFLKREADEVYMAYMFFESGSRHRPVVEKFLPLEFDVGKEELCLAEPKMDDVLTALLPEYIAARMRYVLLNAFACEHSARSIAMGEATDNAKGLLEDLILTRNKVRQANITRDIIEVISSSEALKG